MFCLILQLILNFTNPVYQRPPSEVFLYHMMVSCAHAPHGGGGRQATWQLSLRSTTENVSKTNKEKSHE
jgi:hypothetical protein